MGGSVPWASVNLLVEECLVWWDERKGGRAEGGEGEGGRRGGERERGKRRIRGKRIDNREEKLLRADLGKTGSKEGRESRPERWSERASRKEIVRNQRMQSSLLLTLARDTFSEVT